MILLCKTKWLKSGRRRHGAFVLSVFAPALGGAAYLDWFSYSIMGTFYRPEFVFEFGILLYFALIISTFQRSKLMGALLTSVALRGAPLQSAFNGQIQVVGFIISRNKQKMIQPEQCLTAK